jgi:nicotinamidase-related amidase
MINEWKRWTSASSEAVQHLNIKLNARNLAHVIIDVQREYCDPNFTPYFMRPRGNEYTASISKRIVTFADSLRQADIPTFVVYFSRGDKPEHAGGGFYKLTPAPGDILVAKDHNSAFQGGHIDDELRRRNIKGLLISGFNLTACVRQTVIDARKHGYATHIVADCVGNDSHCYDLNAPEVQDCVKSLKQYHGAHFLSSTTAVEAVEAFNKVHMLKTPSTMLYERSHEPAFLARPSALPAPL